MEKDKKYNLVLGLMIFFFILVVGISLAWGLSTITKNSTGKLVEKEKEQNNPINENEKKGSIKDTSTNKNESETKKVTNLEKTMVEDYVQKIYKYGEFEIMPNFDDINKADEEWVWAIAFSQLENKEMVQKYEVVDKAKELFGQGFNKEPKEDSIISAYWNEELNYYEGKAHGFMAEEEARYIIKDAYKTDNTYNVEIVEYVLNVNEVMEEKVNPQVIIKSGNKIVKTVSENEDYDYVKENTSLFASRILELQEVNGKLHIVSCKNK